MKLFHLINVLPYFCHLIKVMTIHNFCPVNVIQSEEQEHPSDLIQHVIYPFPKKKLIYFFVGLNMRYYYFTHFEKTVSLLYLVFVSVVSCI